MRIDKKKIVMFSDLSSKDRLKSHRFVVFEPVANYRAFCLFKKKFAHLSVSTLFAYNAH